MKHLHIQIKSLYSVPARSDGIRVFIEKHKPAHGSWEELKIDRNDWRLSPPVEIVQQHFKTDPENWKLFEKKYAAFLAEDPDTQKILEELKALSHRTPVTLVYATGDQSRNYALVLKDVLQERLPEK